MLRVLHIFHNMGNGGVENFAMNYYRFIDKEKIQFDFLTSVEEDGFFDQEIQSLGGRIFRAYPKRKNPIRNFFDIVKIVKNNEYIIIHRHTGNSISNIDLLAAKVGGAHAIISHSHAVQAGKKWLHYLSKVIFNVKCEKYACSNAAGEWLFGKRAVTNNEVHIIPNAIDAEKFRYDSKKREVLRKTYCVENNLVVGHVGSFTSVKNHEFAIEIFAEIKKKNKNAVLWLIGEGILKTQIEKKVKELNLDDKVVFWGNRQDVADLMQAMDKFLFPSLHEGMGIVAIEAQCAGLPCYVSADVVPLEVDVTKSVQFISLKDSAKQWAENILRDKPNQERLEGYRKIKQAGFDIRDAVRDLEQRYLTYAKQ